MSAYRVGGHWGVTIVREGTEEPDWYHRRRADDELVAVVVNGDRSLAERICALLNDEPSAAQETPVGGIGCPEASQGLSGGSR